MMKDKLKSIPAKVWVVISGSVVACCLCLGILAVNLPDNAGDQLVTGIDRFAAILADSLKRQLSYFYRLPFTQIMAA